MTTVIKLDASALQILFPEGSEARADLTRAVVIDFARKCIKKDFEGPAFKALKDEASNEAFRALEANKAEYGIAGIRRIYGGSNPYNVEITDEYRREIVKTIDNQYRSILREEVKNHFETFKQELPEIMQPIIEQYQLPGTVATETKRMIIQQLNQTLKALG